MKYTATLLCMLLMITVAVFAQKKSKPTIKGTPHVTDQKAPYAKGTVIVETSLGNIVIALNDSAAPKHSANFRKLAKEGFYEGTTFHRVIPGFMIQGGDPNSKSGERHTHGMGGPDYRIDAEIGLTHARGVIAAARQGDQINPLRQSNGSQFYITVADAKFLDGQYSVFGKVIEGMDVADKIVSAPRDPRDNPNEKVVIKKVTVVE
ncbi:MAG: peptidylprolyl isomerase [Ignavibacteriales bacterium]|nr:peptidylprolyl isomerase [Ignavibacteriales bacterium]